MSVHVCASSSPAFGPARQSVHAAPPAAAVMSAEQTESMENNAKPAGGWLGKLWAAYRKKRADAQLRNLAADMDLHILQDVGAPSWLVNETTLARDLARLKYTDYMRW